MNVKDPSQLPKPISYWRQNWPSSNTHAYVMSSVLKLETMVLIKLSLMITARIDLQSLAFSPSRRQIDSRASFTSTGGFAIERTSTRCCLLIDFTAIQLSTAKQKHKTSFSNIKTNSAYTETAKTVILLGTDAQAGSNLKTEGILSWNKEILGVYKNTAWPVMNEWLEVSSIILSY